METFWQALAAYVVGFVICNLFVALAIGKNRKVQNSGCRLIAEEYYKLAKGIRVLPTDEV